MSEGLEGTGTARGERGTPRAGGRLGVGKAERGPLLGDETGFGQMPDLGDPLVRERLVGTRGAAGRGPEPPAP